MNKQKYLVLLVVIPVFLIFIQVIAFDFLKYDDTINVSENELVLNPSAEHLLDFWKGPYLGLYIPVTYSVWSGLAAISLKIFDGRLDPGLFHLLNLVIHVFNSVLVCFIIRKLFELKQGYGDENRIFMAAVLGALVFGLHPVQVETVSWVTGLKGTLCGLFSLGAIYLYLVYVSEKRFPVYAASTVLFVLAVLSMPSAVAAPVMIFLLLVWLDRRITDSANYLLIVWAALALAAVLITRTAQPMAPGAADYPWLIRPLVALDAVMFYIHKIVWPGVLAIDYCRTPAYVVGRSWHNPYLLMVVPVMVLIFTLRRRPQWLALVGAFVTGILPVSGLLPFTYQEASTVADRYLYLSMTVIAVATAVIVVNKPRPLILGLCLLLVVLSGVKSFYQCRQWQNTESIMAHTLQYFPCSFRANLNYGIALMSRGDFEGAIPYYRTARRMRPEDPLPYYNLGISYAGTGDEELCERQYQRLRIMDQDKAARLKQAAAAFKNLNQPGRLEARTDVDHKQKEK